MAIKRIARSATVVDGTVGDGNLVKIKKPEFLSLVGLPANSIGFKVVRDAKGAPMSKPVIRRTRRSDVQPILSLTFPEGTTAEQVTESLKTYGMTGYNVAEEKGVFRAVRGDLQSIANDDSTVNIKLNDAGLVATIARAQPAEAPAEKSALSLTAIEFDAAKFDEKAIGDWLQRNSIDSPIAESENSDQAYVVRRSAVPEGEETRRVAIEDGVTAVVVRSDTADLPEGYAVAINECCYGNWGWGQLDFSAAMADAIFSDQMREAVNRLDDVLRNILYWSSLPIDVRKTLANNALTQFGVYMGTLLDSLPRQLLVAVVRSAQPQLENSMTQATASGATNPAPAAATPAADEKQLTRADIAKMISDGVAEGLKAAAAPAATTTAAAVAAPAATEGTLTRADITSAVTDVIKPLAERMEKLEGSTIVRAAPVDPAVTNTNTQAEPKTIDGKGDNNIFRGALGSIVKSARAAA